MKPATNRHIYLSLMWRSLIGHRTADAWRNVAWPIGLFLVALIAWEAFVRIWDISIILLPPPSTIFAYIYRRFDLFVLHMWPTLLQTVWGFALAVVGGILLAIVASLTEIGRRGLMPMLVVAQIVPKVALAPLLMLWFGLGDLSRVLIAFLIAFFPMVINTASGLTSVDHDVVLLGRWLTRSRWKSFFKIQIPHALPYIFDGMRVSITLAVTGVIVAEFVTSQRGLGYLILFANGNLDAVLMLAAIIVLSIVGLTLYGIVAVMDSFLVYWRSEDRL
ncbi:MAG: ABC transporter permease [Bradyrhizobium sp.]